MPRAASKAENAKASAKAHSAAETFTHPFLSAWPVPATSSAAPSAVDSIRRMSELQMEIARFAAQCVRKNATTFAAFATCRSPIDFLEIWRRAATEAVTDYADEAERILERAQK